MRWSQSRRSAEVNAVSRDKEPVVGQWYVNAEEEETFRVITVDEDAEMVEIEYLDGEQPVSRRGRIVRVQGLAGDTLGIAIAFDSES